MAVFDSILVPSEPRGTKIAGLAASASSAEQNLGSDQIFKISATDAFHIRFGKAGMAAADATDDLYPADQPVVFDTGKQFTHIRIFNSTAAAIDVYIRRLSRV